MTEPIINEPIKFLGATVLSFNTSAGFGSSQESTLNVDLIEDCEAGDSFLPIDGAIEVGQPVYFIAGVFEFGGVLTNWTVTQGSGGKTYNVKITDPRQLLENTSIVVDSYLGPPPQTSNYFNVYAAYEMSVLDGNCGAFGSSLSTDRGMPYQMVINKLLQMAPIIFSPTGYQFTIDFSTFPTGLPEYYRVNGPTVSILQMLQDVCDVLGYDFFVYLNSSNVIKIGLVDLRNPPSTFNYIIDSYDGLATDLSYGQELRNEKTRSLMFGEKRHYISVATVFNHYFGEDLYGEEYVPVVPFAYNAYGFWINKKIDSLNVTLNYPLSSNGPYSISEADIKAAMSSRAQWEARVFDKTIPGSLNNGIRQAFNNLLNNADNNTFKEFLVDGELVDPAAAYQAYCDFSVNPTGPASERNKPKYDVDIEKIHSFIVNLGQTYYGKQFIAKLNQTICYYQGDEYQEKVYSDIPTTAGGWVEPGSQVLGLADPELSAFREDDSRVSCFAYFDTGGSIPNSDPPNDDGGESGGSSSSSSSNSTPAPVEPA